MLPLLLALLIQVLSVINGVVNTVMLIGAIGLYPFFFLGRTLIQAAKGDKNV